MNAIKTICACVGICAVMFACGVLGTLEHTYTRAGEVIAYDEFTVTVQDDAGHQWKVESTDFLIGERVTLSMHTNCTDYIADDIVEDIKAEQ